MSAQKERLSFQTEVKQLLHLMINALYSNKEIFLRELISNASDAIDKLRFEALSDNGLYENDSHLQVSVAFDKEARTITIKDNGVGMSREEIIDNLGTIAKSGTKEFLTKLTGDQKKDSHLIGQFGVGFYSAFIVADRVSVRSRRAGLTAEHGVLWVSTGDGEYTIENVNETTRGTCVELHLKEDENEFLDFYRLKTIINKYSDHITIPIMMLEPRMDAKDETPAEWKQVNKATALWTLPKNKITDEEYKAMYKHIAHDFDDPLLWIHNHVEGRHDYYTLLYIPKRAPFDLWNREHPRGIKLYVKRVFIMDDAEQLLPLYLRFMRGVVDSSDLPLNISREILQNNRIIESIKTATIKKILTTLEKLAKDEPENYQIFWDQFGQVMKEGPAEDNANRESIAGLLRFSSTHTDADKQTVSLEEYIKRMKSGQEKIYFVTAENFLAAKHSPHLEVFRKNGIEVLLMSDRVDEWLTTHLTEFQGKSLQSVTQGSLDLDALLPEEEKQKQKEKEEAEKTNFDSVLKQMKAALGDRVKEVRITHRLTTSPACIVADNNEMGLQMQRILKAAGQEMKMPAPILELNPEHKLVIHLKSETDEQRFAEWSHILLDQSVLAEGGQLQDAASYVNRLNKLLGEMI